MLCCRSKKKDVDSGFYSKLWRAFIRPPRSMYTIEDMGPRKFLIDGKKVYRFDLELLNSRGQKVKCSYFEIQEVKSERHCVVYVHTHSGSRLESLTCLIPVLMNGFNLFAIDMTGSGHSDGEFVSFGIFEKEDVSCAIDYVRDKIGIKNITLWGRSMGAVTILMYASVDSRVNCIVLDSPFSNLKNLCKEVALRRAIIPGCLTNAALSKVKKTIQEKANFSIDDLDIIKFAEKVKVPTIFITSKGDSFVKHKHSVKLFNAIPHSKKEIMYVKGNHNDLRPKEFLNEVICRINDFSGSKFNIDEIEIASIKPVHYQKVLTSLNYTFNNVQRKDVCPVDSDKELENNDQPDRPLSYIVKDNNTERTK